MRGLLEDIARLIIRMTVLQPIATGLSGFLPAFANGTNFAPGGLALVGERGPEIVNLPRGSQVIPNSQVGGVNVQVINNAPVDIQTQTETTPDGSSLVRFIINTVAGDMSNNGATARALQTTFGARTQAVAR